MSVTRLFLQEHGADQESYGYTDTTDFTILKGANHEIHLLAYAGTPQTAHNAAPVSSLLFNKANGKIYTKADATTWELVTSV